MAVDAAFIVGSAISLFSLVRTVRLYSRAFRERRPSTSDRKAAAVARLETVYSISKEGVVGALGLALIMVGLYERTPRIAPWILVVPFLLAVACALNIVTLRWLLRRFRASVG